MTQNDLHALLKAHLNGLAPRSRISDPLIEKLSDGAYLIWVTNEIWELLPGDTVWRRPRVMPSGSSLEAGRETRGGDRRILKAP